MLWEAGSAKKNLPLDSKALNHNGTYGDGRKTIDDPETVERVETYQGIEHAGGRCLVWAEVVPNIPVKVIFPSLRDYSRCQGAER
ncbi:hypothetical protein H106_04714 [Trichophyton rubrum CBS 735.88]|nr:hypothetical protein H106_04714 [Trichophyton rubrum CBS 735.88]